MCFTYNFILSCQKLSTAKVITYIKISLSRMFQKTIFKYIYEYSAVKYNQ